MTALRSRWWSALWLVLLWGMTLRADACPRAAIPFETASVSAQGDRYSLSWHAAGVRTVKVYAGTDSMHIGTDRQVAGGGSSGAATVRLPAAPRWYFAFVGDGRPPLILADRSLHLASASNFRDVGGYRTQDGKWVRMGVAYRSNGLGALTPTDLDTVNSLGIRLICDLRRDVEREKQPDPTLPGATHLVADVIGDNDASSQFAALKTPANAEEEAAVLDRIKAVYRNFVDLPSARTAYHNLFARLADAGSLPTIFHCTAGKDRTGWGQAVLLTILGVPHETILHDYELTNQSLSPAALAQIHQVMPNLNDEMARRVMAADPQYLEAAFQEVTVKYGSFDHYLREGLGLSPQTIAAIRTHFLTS